MNVANDELVRSLDPSHLDTLEISGWAWADMRFHSYTVVHYPQFDICKETTSGRYDLIIAEQVFEHIADPAKAATNVYQMLKDGGVFLITTPFLIKYHPDPHDYWRWTVEGLKLLLDGAGFEDVQTHSWGNRDCARESLDGFSDFDPSRHSLENDPKLPLVVWAYARRSSVTEGPAQ
jgi:SAM-dependent methyltransferase